MNEGVLRTSYYRLLLSASILLGLSSLLSATPRVWTINPQTTGYTIASNSSQTLTVTFYPKTVAYCNLASSGGAAIYFDISVTSSTATTAVTKSTADRVEPGECHSIPINDPNVNNSFFIALITASSTADYKILAVSR